MAKATERKLAQLLYVNEGKTAKAIAEQLNVNEHTLGDWIAKGNWKALREAHVNTPDRLVSNLRELIGTLTERRLELERKRPETDEEKVTLSEEKIRLADEISKWNKALENAQDDAIISLGDYIRVCEDIFPALHESFPRMVKDLAEFQRRHIDTVASRYQ
jgi:transposase